MGNVKRHETIQMRAMVRSTRYLSDVVIRTIVKYRSRAIAITVPVETKILVPCTTGTSLLKRKEAKELLEFLIFLIKLNPSLTNKFLKFKTSIIVTFYYIKLEFEGLFFVCLRKKLQRANLDFSPPSAITNKM